MSHQEIELSQLGKKTTYINKYNQTLLYPISRIPQDIQIAMHGFDLWNMYELSWLNSKGKPEIAVGQLIYDASSKKLVESKSLKLYLNSFNNSNFASLEEVKSTITNDLSHILDTQVIVKISKLEEKQNIFVQPQGICIDDIDIEILSFEFENRKEILTKLIDSHEIISETLYSNLLRSNCPITSQPDWGTIVIEYTGKKISKLQLLSYILSYRNHNEFHEHCVESIYSEIIRYCEPSKLTVYANYTRRGGIDINPYRSTQKNFDLQNALIHHKRLLRQ